MIEEQICMNVDDNVDRDWSWRGICTRALYDMTIINRNGNTHIIS